MDPLAEALAHHRAGRWDAAERQYRRLLERQPRHAEALHLLGLLAHQRGQSRRALDLIGRAVAAAPDRPLYLNNLGAVQRALGDVGAAEQSFRRSLVAAPNDAVALLNLGNLAIDRGDLTGAAKWLEAAAAADPTSPRAPNNLGSVRHRQGRLGEAAASYRAALARDASHTDAAVNLATILVELGDAAEALAMADRALAAAPNHAGARHIRGVALQALGQPAAAAAALAQAVAAAPAWPEAQRDLALALAANHDWDAAVAACRAAQALAPELEGLSTAMNEAHAALVPRWHFPMMNDRARNALYQQAINASVRPGDLVLEIGTGAGLLAMLAARAGAQVVTCEQSTVVAAAARAIIAKNHLADRITVHAKPSAALAIGRELPRPADLLIAEIFDAGLIGESALPSLAHAREQLLAPDARLIPASARVFAAPVESQALRHSLRVGEIEGFDLSAFNAFAPAGHVQMPLGNLPHRLLAEPVELFAFDFRGAHAFEAEIERSTSIIAGGQIDALALWYELDLAPGCVLSTAPDREHTHWQQMTTLIDPPRLVAAGASITIRGRHDRQQIRLALA